MIQLLILLTGVAMAQVPETFVSLGEICPSLKIRASYATTDNFTGEVVAGYRAPKAFLAKPAAEALCRVQASANKEGVGLKIFDAYRPVKAVEFFQIWAQRPETNPQLKELYYPKYTRLELFEAGYIARQSSHSRGGAVDLTLIDLKTGRDLDMGSAFDYFDELSHTENSRITDLQRANRRRLKRLMEGQGFQNFSQEWWHYSLKPEPLGRAFDFDVE